MDILDLGTSLKFIQHNGVGFNVEERLKLEMALQGLLTNFGSYVQFEELLFWGKITGMYNDYYIAEGINYQSRYEFPNKVFFYCTSTDFEFTRFPDLNDQHRDEYSKIKSMITGNPKTILKKVEPEKVEGQEEEAEKIEQQKEVDPLASSEEEDENAKIVPIDLKEIDRIHYLVLAIENDCHVVPNGAFKLTSTHETHRNEAFRGLTATEAFKLTSYSHFRNVQQKDKKEGLEKDDAIFQRNFLDDVSLDRPIGSWSVQKDSSGNVAILRNLQWPGFYGYHKVNSRTFGSVYIGDGLKNSDLPFML